MKKVYMMVGLPGSGKSTFAKTLNATIFSSDEYREKGVPEDKVFSQLQADLKACQDDVVFDATNLNSKRRRNFLSQVDGYKVCVLVMRTFENCLQANRERDRHVPEEVIDKYYRSFQMPYLEEGFDELQIVYNAKDVLPLPNYDDFDQHSKFHSKTLGEHMASVADYVKEHYSEDEHFDELYQAAQLHDIGKPHTQTFDDEGNAHYYGHESVGAYDSLLMTNNPFVAFLICYHMRPFSMKTEKARNRTIRQWGKEKFDLIEKLHQADMAGK